MAVAKQLPVCDERKKLPVATLKGPKSGWVRGFIPDTQLSDVTAAVLQYFTVSRVAATIAARWVKFYAKDVLMTSG